MNWDHKSTFAKRLANNHGSSEIHENWALIVLGIYRFTAWSKMAPKLAICFCLHGDSQAESKVAISTIYFTIFNFGLDLFNHFHHNRETSCGGGRTTERGSKLSAPFLPSQPWYTTEDRTQHRELHALLFATGLWTLKGCETGRPAYRPYPRRLDRPFADVITKAAPSPQLFKDPECWFYYLTRILRYIWYTIMYRYIDKSYFLCYLGFVNYFTSLNDFRYFNYLRNLGCVLDLRIL